MKKHFILIILTICRIGDLYSTFIAGGGTLKFETSPLVRKLNFNWFGLVLFNLLLILGLFLLMNKYSENYLTKKEYKFKEYINSFSDYLSYTYFSKKLSTKELLIKAKGIDYKVFIHIFIVTLIKVIILLSFFAITNNLLIAFNQKGLLYGFYSKTFILAYFSIIIAFLFFIGYSVNRYRKLIK